MVNIHIMAATKKKVSAGKNEPRNALPEPPPENKVNFEQSLAELERLVAHMEQGDLTLEETLENFERGIQLSKTCQKAIDEAEQRVRILTEKEGSPETEPFGDGAG
uniref:Exodeoxyribonuclease 7 small subunit n=2 Tax=Candidatus Kentrum sp. FM TaxID=2126340 RepID=A0A450SWU3_9GAMM|nr:MAG: exodeoxyribonuclease VII small subunit [Candidatus Kentron sp. FM]VFK11713.1 MAG: exodeoxyribonuclease VII small subunit [Candidatus Kentron sp. FM]